MQTLRSDSGIILQLGRAADPQSVDLIPWRVAFYPRPQHTPSCRMGSFLYRCPSAVTKTLAKQLSDSAFELQNPAEVTAPPSLSPFAASPPVRRQVLAFSAEFNQHGDSLSGVFVGATRRYRDRLEAQNILGAGCLRRRMSVLRPYSGKQLSRRKRDRCLYYTHVYHLLHIEKN